MFNELDTIVLTHDIAEHNLKQGDIGAIVYCHERPNAFDVEFIASDGMTLALLTLDEKDIRPLDQPTIPSARSTDIEDDQQADTVTETTIKGLIRLADSTLRDLPAVSVL